MRSSSFPFFGADRFQAESRRYRIAALEDAKFRRRMLQACSGQPLSSGDGDFEEAPPEQTNLVPPAMLGESHNFRCLSAMYMPGALEHDSGLMTAPSQQTTRGTGSCPLDWDVSKNKAHGQVKWVQKPSEITDSMTPLLSQGGTSRLPEVTFPVTTSGNSRSSTLLVELQGLSQGMSLH